MFSVLCFHGDATEEGASSSPYLSRDCDVMQSCPSFVLFDEAFSLHLLLIIFHVNYVRATRIPMNVIEYVIYSISVWMDIVTKWPPGRRRCPYKVFCDIYTTLAKDLQMSPTTSSSLQVKF